MRFFKVLVCLLVLGSCKPETNHTYSGQAQGTFFTVKYHGTKYEAESDLDSIFHTIDDHFSGYIDASLVSEFNRSLGGIEIDEAFTDLWEKCWEVNIESDGFFDPTLAPVLTLYKVFEDQIDSSQIKEALANTGMQLISVENGHIRKKHPKVRLDFDGIAQGYTVDQIALHLEGKDVKNYLVEVGGEVRAKGKNPAGHPWLVGIDRPKTSGKRELIAKVELIDHSLATSGNYRKFKEIQGKKVGHIIDPKTGFPAETTLLSTSVFSESCYRADALATAFMNIPVEDAINMSSELNDVSVILIYLSGNDTLKYVSPELINRIRE